LKYLCPRRIRSSAEKFKMEIKNFKIIIIGAIFLAAAGLFAAQIKYLSDGKAVGTANVAIDEDNTAQREKQEKSPVEILAFGDLLLDRYIKLYIDRNSPEYPFENIKEVFAGNDIVLANLEGSFTDFAPRPLDPNNTSFTFDPKLAAMLKSSGFNLVNLANNHVRDFGRDGFAQSRAYLEQNSIGYFGDYYNESPALVKEASGRKIAFIGYHSLADPATAGTIEK